MCPGPSCSGQPDLYSSGKSDVDLDLKRIFEGALFASREPMSIYQMKKLFGNQKAPTEGMYGRLSVSLSDDYQAVQPSC